MEKIKEIYQRLLQCTGISTDTRKLNKGNLFFALSGEKFNGNQFAAEAIQKGAAVTIVDDSDFIPPNDNRYILVKNTLDTLQQLAKFHRQHFNIPVLAITGTNGKTTTKELCSAVLSSEKIICSTKGNFNNHIGVPLTLLQINQQTEIAVVEMGANHPGEIEALCNIAQPTHGLITNIGKAHLEGFGDFQGVMNTKNELYRFIAHNKGTVFVHKGDPLLMELSKDINRITYGDLSADIKGKPEAPHPFVKLKWFRQENDLTISTQLYGSYNFNNVMAAIAVGQYFGISEPAIIRAIENYKPDNNRSQILQTTNNTLILDAYNANPDSMRLAIKNFAAQQFSHPVLILGDMFELGKVSTEEHRKIIEILKDTSIQQVILIGKDFYKAKKNNLYVTFSTTAEAMQYLKNHPIKNAQILIKGSRGMQLENIIQYL